MALNVTTFTQCDYKMTDPLEQEA